MDTLEELSFNIYFNIYYFKYFVSGSLDMIKNVKAHVVQLHSL